MGGGGKWGSADGRRAGERASEWAGVLGVTGQGKELGVWCSGRGKWVRGRDQTRLVLDLSVGWWAGGSHKGGKKGSSLSRLGAWRCEIMGGVAIDSRVMAMGLVGEQGVGIGMVYCRTWAWLWRMANVGEFWNILDGASRRQVRV